MKSFPNRSRRGSRRRAGAAVVVGLVCGVMSWTVADASSPGDIDRDAVLRYAVPGVVQSMDPRTANEFQQVFLEQVYEPLIRTTVNGDHQPGLALEWGLVDDGTAFELTLREGVTFHDGTPFDAAAVAANLEAAVAEGSNLAADLDVVEAVEIVDDYHVRLELNGPGGHLVGILAGYPGMMVSPEAFDTDVQNHPVGAGPFVVTEQTERSLVLERWDGYYAADEVTIGGIEFTSFSDESTRMRALVDGQLDAAFVSSSQVPEAEANGFEVLSTTQTTFHGFLLNTSHEALAIPEVRIALMLSIDREAISTALYGGRCTPTLQPYPDGFWGFSPELAANVETAYDPERAQQLLAEAGYPDGLDIELKATATTIYSRLAEVLQEQFGAVGVRVEVDISNTLGEQRRNGDFEIISGAYQVGRPDPTAYATNYFSVDGPQNFGAFDFGIDELIVESRQSTDTAERAVPIHELIATVLEQGPTLIPVCIPESITAVAPGWTGLDLSVVGTRDFRFAHVER